MRAALLISLLLCTAARAGWTAGAWPACEHVGGREFAPGVLFKQIWARDIFRALEERCQAVSASGNTNIWVVGGIGSRPTWWTEAGVTNQVVRFDRGQFNAGADYLSRVLPACKDLAGKLAIYFVDTNRLDVAEMPDAWHDLQVAGGGRANVPVLSETFTAWVWDCPGVAHSQAFTVYEAERLGSLPYRHTATGLATRVSLPRDYFAVSPFRLLEGFCDPDTALLAPAFVYAPTGQGTSPHGTGLWYWTDFGWDGLRAALARMTHQVVAENGSPLDPDWFWDEEDGDNRGQGTGQSIKTYVHPESGPDEVAIEGSHADAVSERADDFTTFVDSNGPPFFEYFHVFAASDPDVEPGHAYTCSWLVKFAGCTARPRLKPAFAWPPAGVTAAARYFCDVQTWEAPAGQVAWSTEELGSTTFATPGTNAVVLATAYGHHAIDSGIAPGDAASAQGLPRDLGLIGDVDDVNEHPDWRRGNGYRESKNWSNPFVLIEYTWSYP